MEMISSESEIAAAHIPDSGGHEHKKSAYERMIEAGRPLKPGESLDGTQPKGIETKDYKFDPLTDKQPEARPDLKLEEAPMGVAPEVKEAIKEAQTPTPKAEVKAAPQTYEQQLLEGLLNPKDFDPKTADLQAAVNKFLKLDAGAESVN